MQLHYAMICNWVICNDSCLCFDMCLTTSVLLTVSHEFKRWQPKRIYLGLKCCICVETLLKKELYIDKYHNGRLLIFYQEESMAMSNTLMLNRPERQLNVCTARQSVAITWRWFWLILQRATTRARENGAAIIRCLMTMCMIEAKWPKWIKCHCFKDLLQVGCPAFKLHFLCCKI